MQGFHSKIDWWVIAFVIAFSGLLTQLLLTMYARGTLLDYALHTAVFILAIVLIWWPILTTRYVIENDHLRIHALWFKWNIALKDIHAITPSQNSKLSPALSFTRLQIDYTEAGETKSILISPRHPQQFKQLLQQ